MTMNNRFEQQYGAYHFALSEMVDFMQLYRVDTVLKDLQDYLDLREYNLRKREEVYHTEFGGVYE